MSALTTHIVTKSEKREKKRRNELENSNKGSKAKQKPKQDHLREKNLGPLRQGQWLDTTETKCSKIADSLRWGKRARHNRQKSTTKIKRQRAPKCMSAIPPKQMHFSQIFSLDAKLPPGNMNWVLSSPLLVMHESSLQIQACASQIYKEHYNMLKVRHRQAR
jgi:hypothetical protein